MIVLMLAAAQAGQALQSGATLVDRVVAYGAVALMVGLIVWHGRSSGSP